MMLCIYDLSGDQVFLWLCDAMISYLLFELFDLIRILQISALSENLIF